MRTFTNVPLIPYIGVPFYNITMYKGKQGILCPLLINWLNYGASTVKANLAVGVNFQNGIVDKKLDRIRSVYIDNMGSDVPIYVLCPDTGYVVVAAPNTAGWFRLFTNAYNIIILGLGFLTNDIPQTAVFVTNLEMDNFTDVEISQALTLYKASNTISRGTTIYNANVGVPALGDQFGNTKLNIAGAAPVTSTLFGGPQPSGFWYINSFVITFQSGDVANGGILVGLPQFQILSTGASGILVDISSVYFSSFQGGAGFVFIPNPVLAMEGMNLKIDATQTWQFKYLPHPTVFSVASANLNMCFTFNPT